MPDRRQGLAARRGRGASLALSIGAGALVLPLAALGLTACGTGDRGSASSSSGDQTGFIAGDGTVTVIPAAERLPAPPVAGTTLDGQPWSLADHRGRVVVLNIWASWCAPCRAEAAELRTASIELPDVDFVGLNTRDSPAAARAFLKRFGLEYPTVVDSDGGLQAQFAGTLPPQAIPSTLVIDAEGRVAARVIGRVSAPTLSGVVEEVSG